MVINGFADDHSIRKNFKAGHRSSTLVTENELETAFIHIKNWMDTVHLKYILFGSTKQLKKYQQNPSMPLVILYL